MNATIRLATDTGGTFTDLVTFDEHARKLAFFKVASTPENPGQAIVSGMTGGTAVPGSVRLLIHGTTVATNAVLQRRGARVALITTTGFRDVLQIQRQDRPRMYDLRSRRTPSLIPRRLRFELTERMSFDGKVRTPIDRDELADLIEILREEQIEAAAVGLLHSYANATHEIEVGRAIRAALPGVTVSLSHELAGEHGEYERFSTCAMNAFVQPVLEEYLSTLETDLADAGCTAPLLVMKSNGGVMSAERAASQCVETILSGPAGGVVAGAAIARSHTNANLITADMGGTSFDVSVIHAGEPSFARDAEMGGLALAVPMLDIHTVGAGGGSIAWVDSGGALRVGPQSAGAVPGPACYGRGGDRPTVTDANLVLGRLARTSLLGGTMSLDAEAARRAVHNHLAKPLGMSIEAAAEGVLRVVNATMTAAIRKLTVERGHDPREFVLCPFGGAGPLHGAELAAELGIKQTLVPIAPGVTSALGLLMSNLREDRVRTHIALLDYSALADIECIFDELERDATMRLAMFAGERSTVRQLGMRYHGQRYELAVPAGAAFDVVSLEDDFHQAHQQQYGYARRREPIEIATVWVSVEIDLQPVTLPLLANATAPPEPKDCRTVVFAGQSHDTPVFDRAVLAAGSTLAGPAIIEQLDSTMVIWPDQNVNVDEYGQLLMEEH